MPISIEYRDYIFDEVLRMMCEESRCFSLMSRRDFGYTLKDQIKYDIWEIEKKESNPYKDENIIIGDMSIIVGWIFDKLVDMGVINKLDYYCVDRNKLKETDKEKGYLVL